MGIFAGLLSLTCLSLFLGWALRRSSALMPLVAVCLSIVYFTLAGVLGLLRPAALVWYVLCAAAALFTILANGQKTLGLLSPGLVFFFVGCVALITFYLLSRPMLTHWDEFTFWGTAAKATGQSGLLYTQAPSNLIAKAYPPGLIVFAYMMQFFVPGGFSEPTFIACFAVLYLACLCSATAVWDKSRTSAAILFCALFLLPFLFSEGGGGATQWVFQVCMADMPMALIFGGSLCFYFGGHAGAEGFDEPGMRVMLPFGIILAALVCVKDMGLALALIALFVVLCDMCFCRLRRVGFWKLRRFWAVAASAAWCLLLIAGAYLVWALHMKTAGMDRFNLGSGGGESLGQVQMVATGLQMLFGQGRSQQFGEVLSLMVRALWSRPVSLFGSGVVVLAVILLISAMAFLLGATRTRRRQVVVFTIAMGLCFAAFYVFNIFTYGLIFQPQEALVLKDYQRYIAPFWAGWLMAALVLLCRAAQSPKATFYRLRVGQGAANLTAALLCLGVMLTGNWQANFLRMSPSYYQARHSVQAVMADALDQGMRPGDKVYILSQGDDGSRFYLFGYEMDAERALVFNGYDMELDGTLKTDEAGKPQYVGNVAATLVAPGTEHPVGMYPMECSREDLVAFLRLENCTHLLIDVLDEYVVEEFGPLFSDHLVGWDPDDIYATGHRYYAIRWDDAGGCTLIPAHLARGGGAA